MKMYTVFSNIMYKGQNPVKMTVMCKEDTQTESIQ